MKKITDLDILNTQNQYYINFTVLEAKYGGHIETLTFILFFFYSDNVFRYPDMHDYDISKTDSRKHDICKYIMPL